MDNVVDHLFSSAYHHLDNVYNVSPELFVQHQHQLQPHDVAAIPEPVEPPVIDEEPLYVNAKQYFRILKRRVARARLEELHRLSKQRKVMHFSSYFLPLLSLIELVSRICTNHVTNTLCAVPEVLVDDS